MKKRNIVFGALLLFGGYWIIKNFLDKKVEVKKPELKYREKNTDRILKIRGGEVAIPLNIQEDYYKMRQAYRPTSEGIADVGVPYGFKINPDFSKSDFSDWVKK